MLNKRSQTYNATYCMIQFIRYSGKGITTGIEKQSSGCQGMGMEEEADY